MKTQFLDESQSRRRYYARKRHRIVLISLIAVAAAVIVPLCFALGNRHSDRSRSSSKAWYDVTIPDWIEQDLIDVDGVSRDGEKLEAFHDVVIHYVGNPDTTARQNRNYFNNPDSSVSAHFVVGLDGEIIQCIPLSETSAASNNRNGDTISIEVCHPDDTGKFNEATYRSLVKLTAWLLQAGDLSVDHVIRHYDITGKECPRYFVRNPEAWEEFLQDVRDYD